MSAAPTRRSGPSVAAASPTVGRSDIEAAAARLSGVVRRTPVLDPGPGAFGLDPSVRLTLKLELTQHTGSFKPRGAANRLLAEAGDGSERPVAAASGGNHGQAVAWVAARFGRRATVFVPELASPVKRARISAYGADLVVGGAAYADAQAACDTWVARSGALRIHPYDDPAVVAGQGTVGLELAEQAPHLDTVLVAVGGGGLIAGIAAWYGGRGVRVVAVEPEGACCLARRPNGRAAGAGGGRRAGRRLAGRSPAGRHRLVDRARRRGGRPDRA